MITSEFTANKQLSDLAAERAKWAAILAKPAKPAARKPAKPAGFFARYFSI